MNYQRDFDLFSWSVILWSSTEWLSFPDLTDVDLDSFRAPLSARSETFCRQFKMFTFNFASDFIRALLIRGRRAGKIAVRPSPGNTRPPFKANPAGFSAHFEFAPIVHQSEQLFTTDH
jgi:hypothetical protein